MFIPIHHHSREVQIDRQLVHVSVTAFQPLGIYKCHELEALYTHSLAYLPGLKHFFHVLQGSRMALLSMHKSDNFGWFHREGLVVGDLLVFVHFSFGWDLTIHK
jgi:hypothetical protein